MAEGEQIRERALQATGISFTLADARAPDQPLTWVNPAFTAMTGYAVGEALGHNCRFLQGPDTDPHAVAALRRATREGTDRTVTLLTYRKDGSAFWNEVGISPVRDTAGVVTHFVGVQTDVTERVAPTALGQCGSSAPHPARPLRSRPPADRRPARSARRTRYRPPCVG